MVKALINSAAGTLFIGYPSPLLLGKLENSRETPLSQFKTW